MRVAVRTVDPTKPMVATAKDGRSFEGFALATARVVIEISSTRTRLACPDQRNPRSQPTIVRGATTPRAKQTAWIVTAAFPDRTAKS
jgi:hypothetical protein